MFTKLTFFAIQCRAAGLGGVLAGPTLCAIYPVFFLNWINGTQFDNHIIPFINQTNKG